MRSNSSGVALLPCDAASEPAAAGAGLTGGVLGPFQKRTRRAKRRPATGASSMQSRICAGARRRRCSNAINAGPRRRRCSNQSTSGAGARAAYCNATTSLQQSAMSGCSQLFSSSFAKIRQAAKLKRSRQCCRAAELAASLCCRRKGGRLSLLVCYIPLGRNPDLLLVMLGIWTGALPCARPRSTSRLSPAASRGVL